jgi:hypothetical protein
MEKLNLQDPSLEQDSFQVKPLEASIMLESIADNFQAEDFNATRAMNPHN